MKPRINILGAALGALLLLGRTNLKLPNRDYLRILADRGVNF